MRMYGYDDRWDWGKKVCASAKSLGIDTFLFVDPKLIPNENNTYAFVHLAHHPNHIKERDKRVCQIISLKENVKLIPSLTECIMYDDKIMYYEKCPKWCPKTFVIKSEDCAFNVIGQMSFPFISKSRDGAASSNVRLIRKESDARREIFDAFKNEGIKKFEGKQRGYLIWQEFCLNNTNDWRVIMIAKKYGYVLKRNNRPDIPFASGSGNLEPVRSLTPLTSNLLDFTRKFAIENDFIFVGVDIVFDNNQKPVILEMTTGWDINGYKNCMIYKYDGNEFIPTGLDGKDHMADIIVRCCLDGDF